MKLLKYLYNIIGYLYDKKINSNGLAIFRVVWAVVLLMEIYQLFTFRDLRFDPIPFIKGFELSVSAIVMVWFFIALFILFGFKTKLNLLLNYLFSILFFGSLYAQEYPVFKIYIAINFILIFIPVSNSYSIDNLIKKVKFTKNNYLHKTDNKTSVIYYYLVIIIGIVFFYFDSSLSKISSQTWLTGRGNLQVLSLPNFIIRENDFFLKNLFLVKVINYAILIFEFLFVFLFFRKKLRWTVIIIGLSIQVGILYLFPFPLLAIALSSLYILIIPVGMWTKLKLLVTSEKSKITFIYDANCPLCTKTRVVIENIDFLKRIDFQPAQTAKDHYKELREINQDDLITHIYSVSKKGNIYKGVDTYIQVLLHTIIFSPLALIISIPGLKHIGKYLYNFIAKNREIEKCDEDHCMIYLPPEKVDENKNLIKGFSQKKVKVLKLTLLIFFLILAQLNTTIGSGILGKIGFWKTNIGSFIEPIHKSTINFTQSFIGISHHPVLMDGHLNQYNTIFAVTYINNKGKEIWLPIIDEKGKPGSYNYGVNWANWTFRVNGINYSKNRLFNGLIRYTSFWAGKHNKNLNNLTFTIKLKRIITSTHCNSNFSPKIDNNNAWVDFGEINWIDKKANINVFYELNNKETNQFKKIE